MAQIIGLCLGIGSRECNKNIARPVSRVAAVTSQTERDASRQSFQLRGNQRGIRSDYYDDGSNIVIPDWGRRNLAPDRNPRDAVDCARTIRVLSVMDAYTRECLALEVGTSFASRRVTRVLDAIVAERGQPLAIRCDNGPELTSRHFLAWCVERQIELVLWFVDLERPAPVRVDTDAAFVPKQELNPSWSPDSGWIAYTKLVSNHMRAVFVYSLVSGRPRQLTDGMSDAENAAFDKGGKYLYFTASVNSGPTMWSMDMSSAILAQGINRTVCLMLLQRDSLSPLSEPGQANSSTLAVSERPRPPDSGSEVRIDSMELVNEW